MPLPARFINLLKSCLKILIPAIVLLAVLEIYLYETRVQVIWYPNDFKYKDIDSLPPLTGCFSEERVSSLYNVTERVYSPKRNEIQTGMNVRFGTDCYDLVGTIKPVGNGTLSAETLYHTYYTGTMPLTPRNEAMIQSFFATQNLKRSTLILWSTSDLTQDPIVRKYLQAYPGSFSVKMLASEATRSEVGVPLDTLWENGGVWIDIDVLLTRDLEPLLEHEFVIEWGCGEAKPLIMHFFKNSPYLCEASHSAPFNDWEILFSQLWRRLVAESIPPFKIIPYCFVGSRTCEGSAKLPKASGNSGWVQGSAVPEVQLEGILGKVFGVHLPIDAREFPRDGWVQRLLLRKYDLQ